MTVTCNHLKNNVSVVVLCSPAKIKGNNSPWRAYSRWRCVARLSSVKHLWHFYSEHYGFLWNRNFEGLFDSVAYVRLNKSFCVKHVERINSRLDGWSKKVVGIKIQSKYLFPATLFYVYFINHTFPKLNYFNIAHIYLYTNFFYVSLCIHHSLYIHYVYIFDFSFKVMLHNYESRGI